MLFYLLARELILPIFDVSNARRIHRENPVGFFATNLGHLIAFKNFGSVVMTYAYATRKFYRRDYG
jgi:hypothetical protein